MGTCVSRPPFGTSPPTTPSDCLKPGVAAAVAQLTTVHRGSGGTADPKELLSVLPSQLNATHPNPPSWNTSAECTPAAPSQDERRQFVTSGVDPPGTSFLVSTVHDSQLLLVPFPEAALRRHSCYDTNDTSMGSVNDMSPPVLQLGLCAPPQVLQIVDSMPPAACDGLDAAAHISEATNHSLLPVEPQRSGSSHCCGEPELQEALPNISDGKDAEMPSARAALEAACLRVQVQSSLLSSEALSGFPEASKLLSAPVCLRTPASSTLSRKLDGSAFRSVVTATSVTLFPVTAYPSSPRGGLGGAVRTRTPMVTLMDCDSHGRETFQLARIQFSDPDACKFLVSESTLSSRRDDYAEDD